MTDINEVVTFLEKEIGAFVSVTIVDNTPKIDLFLDKSKMSQNGLSDNGRCYTLNSVPNMTREKGIIELIDNFCEKRKIDDITFYINVGDYPIIHKDKTKHPWNERFVHECNVYPKKIDCVFSRSIITDDHEDLLFPSRDFIHVVYDKDNIIKKTNFNFSQKKNMCVFRGSHTGSDRTINNTRIQAKILSLQYPDYLDADITITFPYYMFDTTSNVGFVRTVIDDKNIIDYESDSKSMSLEEQCEKYKYILHIDGFVAAWRLAKEMLLMSVILKVESEWIEHYYHLLKPWIHYIPVKKDLSDLIDIIIWCNDHENECQQIALNAYNFAVEYMTEENMYDYLENILDKKQNETKENENEMKILKSIPASIVKLNPKPIDTMNIKYKKYLLQQNMVKFCMEYSPEISHSVLVPVFDPTFERIINSDSLKNEFVVPENILILCKEDSQSIFNKSEIFIQMNALIISHKDPENIVKFIRDFLISFVKIKKFDHSHGYLFGYLGLNLSFKNDVPFDSNVCFVLRIRGENTITVIFNEEQTYEVNMYPGRYILLDKNARVFETENSGTMNFVLFFSGEN